MHKTYWAVILLLYTRGTQLQVLVWSWSYLQVQEPVLHEDLSALLLEQGFSVRILRQRLHQVVFGKTEKVGVTDAADVRCSSVPSLTAWTEREKPYKPPLFRGVQQGAAGLLKKWFHKDKCGL